MSRHRCQYFALPTRVERSGRTDDRRQLLVDRPETGSQQVIHRFSIGSHDAQVRRWTPLAAGREAAIDTPVAKLSYYY